MKYKMGVVGEFFEVPEGLIEIFQKAGGDGCKRDCEKCDSFDDCLDFFISQDRFNIYPDNIYPGEIGEFIFDYFDNNRRTFTARKEVGDWFVISYGVLPDSDKAHSWEPDMLAYKISTHASKEDAQINLPRREVYGLLHYIDEFGTVGGDHRIMEAVANVWHKLLTAYRDLTGEYFESDPLAPPRDICDNCGKKAIWHLETPGGEFLGPFCEDCSIEWIFEYTGWERVSIESTKR